MGRLSVVVLVVLASTAGVFADLVTSGGSLAGSGSASLSSSGSATLSGSGTYYQWVGWPTNAWNGVGINFGNATRSFGSGPAGVGSNPTGSATVALDPTDSPAFDAFTRLQHGSLNTLSVDIKDGASYGLGTFGGNGWDIAATRSDNGAQIGTLSLGTFSLALSSLGFNMTGGATGSLTGYSSNPSANQMVSATYSVAPWGNLGTTLAGTTVTASYWDPWRGWTTLQTFGIGGSSATTGEALSGTMIATELAGPYPRDVQVQISADTTAPVSVGFGNSGGVTGFTNYSGGTNAYYVVNLNYGVNGTASVNSAHVDLYSTLTDVIPEPMTLAVFGLGGALLTLARRRTR